MVEIFSLQYVWNAIQNNIILFVFVIFSCPIIWKIIYKPYSKRNDKKVGWIGGICFAGFMLIALFLYSIFTSEPIKEFVSLRSSFYSRFCNSFSAILLCIIISFFNWTAKLVVKFSNKKAIPTDEPSIDSKLVIAFLAMFTLIVIGFRTGIDDYVNTGITMILGFFVSLQFLLGDKIRIEKASIVDIAKRQEVVFSIVLDVLYVFICPFGNEVIITLSTGLFASCVLLGIMLVVIHRRSKSKKI